MMACALVPLLVTVLLTPETFALPYSSVGVETPSSCSPGWLLFGQRCFAFYPVWSSWSDAKSLCSQTGSNLVSLHTLEEVQFLRRLTNTNTSVWLGGYQERKDGSWFWSDESPLSISDWTHNRLGKTREARVCMEMEPKSGELHSTSCEELRFYICSASPSITVVPSSMKAFQPGIFANVSLFDVVWSNSDMLAEEILHSSPFLRELGTSRLTEKCYTSFIQHEALYLHRVSSTLQVLISHLYKADDMRSLLLDTLKHYSSRNQSLLTSPLPEWLHFSLQAFHDVVLEEPVYWVVALSARASLRNFLARNLLPHKLRPRTQLVSGFVVKTLYQMWNEDSMKEMVWTHRYKKVIVEHQNEMDVFKAINIFRAHMISQKTFYKAITCDAEDERL
ncbi:uncharacterized protein LOC113151541 isoform X2 [Anabas testudineus]|nr:uncharacterized protein LOC113151541 isoform X2 [Anabas testudineus]